MTQRPGGQSPERLHLVLWKELNFRESLLDPLLTVALAQDLPLNLPLPSDLK